MEESFQVFQSKNFDFIVLSSLLHEVVSPKNLLEVVYSLCDSNTICHINVPNALSFHLLWAYKAGLFPNLYELTETAKRFQRYSVFDLDQLKKIITRAGFQVLDDGGIFIKPFDHKTMSNLLDQKILTDRHLDGLDKLIEYFPDNGSEIFVNVKKQPD